MSPPVAPSVTIDPLKYLKSLPEFYGDKKDLYNFLNLVDRIHPVLTQYDTMSQLVFSDLIKSRLQGKAREVIEINFHVQSWTDIKNVLVNNFGEKLSMEELYDRLRSVVFKTTTLDFYNEIKDRLRSLNNKTSMILGSNAGAQQVAANNMKSALNIFKEKIPEPMKTILACRNPGSLEDAFEILFKSGYAYYGNKPEKTQSSDKNNKSRNPNHYQNNKQGTQTNSQHRPNNYPPNRPNNYPQNNQQRTYTNYQHRSNFHSNYPQNNQQRTHTNRPNTNPNYYQNNQNRTSSNLQYNSGTNYQQPEQPNPEPMDINMIQNTQTHENFQSTASTANYLI